MSFLAAGLATGALMAQTFIMIGCLTAFFLLKNPPPHLKPVLTRYPARDNGAWHGRCRIFLCGASSASCCRSCFWRCRTASPAPGSEAPTSCTRSA